MSGLGQTSSQDTGRDRQVPPSAIPVAAPIASPAVAQPMNQAVLKDVRRSLVSAQDAQITRVVSLLDAMSDRGAADALIAPLRPRLVQLRPRRPLNFTRLLFLPVDPLIMAAAKWRRTFPGLPRTALTPLMAQIRRGIPDVVEQVEILIDGHSIEDRATVRQAGALIWGPASEILATAPMPAEWPSATGLGQAEHARLALIIAGLLSQGSEIITMVHEALSFRHPDIARLRRCLAAAAAFGLAAGDPATRTETGRMAIGTTMAILLARLPRSEELITAAGDLAAADADPAIRQAADQAIDFILDAVDESGASASDLDSATDAHERIAILLEALERPGPTHRPGRKSRAEKLRTQIDLSCRKRFEADLSQSVLTPAKALAADTPDASVLAVEVLARQLRRFETIGRRFGINDHYDILLKNAIETLKSQALDPSMRMERARLVEILSGPEEAMALLMAS